MRLALAALVLLALPLAARAEDMVAINPMGIMCRDERSLAEFTGPDGSVKPAVIRDAFSPTMRAFEAACQDNMGAPVHVVSKRRNTSIVTLNGRTWYVPNIDYMTPTPDCIREGAKVTMTGTIGQGIRHTEEDNSDKGYPYPRLVLDKPVCYVGDRSEKEGRYVSLPATSEAGAVALTRMVGRHVTVTGAIGSPDNGNQPPDAMMIFDPVVRPTP